MAGGGPGENECRFLATVLFHKTSEGFSPNDAKIIPEHKLVTVCGSSLQNKCSGCVCVVPTLAMLEELSLAAHLWTTALPGSWAVGGEEEVVFW